MTRGLVIGVGLVKQDDDTQNDNILIIIATLLPWGTCFFGY